MLIIIGYNFTYMKYKADLLLLVYHSVSNNSSDRTKYFHLKLVKYYTAEKKFY